MRLFNIIALSAAALALASCGNAGSAKSTETAAPAEAALKKAKVDTAAIAQMSPVELLENATVQSNQFADVLSNVKDEASAEAAIEKMRALGPQLKAVGERLDNMNEDDIKLSLKTMKTMQGFAEAQMRIFNETGRIAADHPELRDLMTEAFEDVEIDFQ